MGNAGGRGYSPPLMQEGKRAIAGLSRHVDGFSRCGVLVVGDVMLDEYVTGAVERISPEAPVPVVTVKSIDHRLGGAANVTNNVRALGARAWLAGVVGDDGHGRMLRERVDAAGIDASAIVLDPSRPTSVKTRVVAQKQQIVRYDRESAARLPSRVADRLLERVQAILPKVQVVVLSDYAKGVLGEDVVASLVKACRAAGKPVMVDPKTKNFPFYGGATIVTPNFKEAREAASLVAGIHVESQADLERAAPKVMEKLGIESLVVTKGEEGMYLFTGDAPPLHIPTAAREVYDVSGAGDTVVAALAVAIAAGAPLPEAAMIANHAAGVVVAKFGTATATAEELRATLDRDEAATPRPAAKAPKARRK